MKNWLDFCPVGMRYLWVQLAVTYTLLAICAMTLLVIILYGLNDYKDFQATYTLGHIEKNAAKEDLTVAQMIRGSSHDAWQRKAFNNIRERLESIEAGGSADIYRITNSSIPRIYIQVTDQDNNFLMSDPAVFPEEINSQFLRHGNSLSRQSDSLAYDGTGPIWIDRPIVDESGNLLGHFKILYIAEFDPLVQLRSIFSFLLNAWDWIVICSIPIGVLCGLIASRYVTTQLQKMNDVTESWRQGNFQARIALPNDDVLIRHSQHLNAMAQDMEMFLSLKQNIAVGEERNRVARELHDTVKQKLFALGLQLATAKSKPAVMDAAREHILEAETITREAQYDLMEIITQLLPTGTGSASLHDRIHIILDDFKRRFSVDTVFHHADLTQCNAHTEHHVLRIVQEALMNAVRHGKSSMITIRSTIDGDTTSLMIADNGKGFDPARQTGGFGLVSMRDRMRELPGGGFNIQSAVGVGTQITLSWKNETYD